MNYTVLKEASKALRQLLLEGFQAEPSVNAIVGGEGGISFDHPATMNEDGPIHLSLWLHQVVENEFLKNNPPLTVTVNGTDRRRPPPLPLNLFYLITPVVGDREAELMLLGKTMEVLYDNPIVILRDAEHPQNPNLEDELRIILCRLTLEELTRIWEALQAPYRLSVCYQVRVTRIDSQRDLNGARVIERDAGFGQTPRLAPR
jgi:hypothetical protein